MLSDLHPYRLYTYGCVENIPRGCEVRDGNEIIPESRISDFWCLAMFADLFRYALLYRGGWYADLDFVCLKPLDFPEPYIFYRDQDMSTVTTALCKSPKDAPVMKYLFDTVNVMPKAHLQAVKYQEIGPDLTRKMLMPNTTYAYGARHQTDRRFVHLQQYFKPGITFDPINYRNVSQVVDPNVKWDLSQSHALHLFSGAWEGMPQHHARADYAVLGSKDKKYPAGCLYEDLKERYL